MIGQICKILKIDCLLLRSNHMNWSAHCWSYYGHRPAGLSTTGKCLQKCTLCGVSPSNNTHVHVCVHVHDVQRSIFTHILPGPHLLRCVLRSLVRSRLERVQRRHRAHTQQGDQPAAHKPDLERVESSTSHCMLVYTYNLLIYLLRYTATVKYRYDYNYVIVTEAVNCYIINNINWLVYVHTQYWYTE